MVSVGESTMLLLISRVKQKVVNTGCIVTVRRRKLVRGEESRAMGEGEIRGGGVG